MIIISTLDKCNECVVCKEPFVVDDDIVVCPECGAPHHRECWKSEGHCHYESAHGTDLEWRPKEESKEEPAMPEQPPAGDASKQTITPMVIINGVPMAKCPGCGKMVPCGKEETRCSRCGHTIPPCEIPAGFGLQQPFMDKEAAEEPLDNANVGKFARIIMQRAGYYIPRFKRLKSQGKSIVSWNWSAALLRPYWLAYRKCYLWAVLASVVEVVGSLILSPVSMALTQAMPETVTSYADMMEVTAKLLQEQPIFIALTYGVMLLYVLRGLIFGLFGNYIYKKECIRRIEILDKLPTEEATYKAHRLSGVNFFAPLLFYYGIYIVQSILTTLI